MNKFIKIFVLCFLSIGVARSQVQTIEATNFSEMTAEKWGQDLNYMVTEMQKVHQNIFHSMTRDQLNSFVTDLNSKIPSLSDNQMIVELLKLMTMIGDGHTYLLPNNFHLFPIRLYQFDDGV